ncbi:MAG: aryl-sulfate sulfotransferase [Sphingomonadales bacterium]|nr:MAG: aryl-sulfate sulfotransferase [Sphingomonadales bacterium]TNF05520.1 MAG: aryl-sulfate sulfotransferase [Sphingomonadales bacterium]
MSMAERPDILAAPASLHFAGPVKHSITIEGHQTSISLEPLFWDALRRAAQEEDIPLNRLVAHIDELRISSLSAPARDDAAPHPPANLASAIRSWLWARYSHIG